MLRDKDKKLIEEWKKEYRAGHLISIAEKHLFNKIFNTERTVTFYYGVFWWKMIFVEKYDSTLMTGRCCILFSLLPKELSFENCQCEFDETVINTP